MNRTRRQAKRIIVMIILLSRQRVIQRSLAERFSCSIKTIRRDIQFMEDIGIPVYEELVYDEETDSNYRAGQLCMAYRVDHKWMRSFI